MDKETYIETLKSSLEKVLNDLAESKGFKPDLYDCVKDLVYQTASSSYDVGFDYARISYSIHCINALGEVFKKEK